MNQSLLIQSPSQEERKWAMICHFAGLAGSFAPPFNIFAPLFVWLLKRGELPYVEEQGKEVVNFHLSMTIYGVVAYLLMIVLIGFVLLAVICLLVLVFGVIGSVKASNGEPFRYPLTIRLVR